MFADLARDDVFRLETPRLWLRWPRAADAAAIERYSSLWEVARNTSRIPHPYPPGSAERFIFAAREGNASGRDLTLVVTTLKAPREAIGAISLETRGGDRLALGYAFSPDVWGKGFASEAAAAIVGAGFTLTTATAIHASAIVENEASKRVLEKVGFAFVDRGLEGAPARGAMRECDRFVLARERWLQGRATIAKLSNGASAPRPALRP